MLIRSDACLFAAPETCAPPSRARREPWPWAVRREARPLLEWGSTLRSPAPTGGLCPPGPGRGRGRGLSGSPEAIGHVRGSSVAVSVPAARPWPACPQPDLLLREPAGRGFPCASHVACKDALRVCALHAVPHIHVCAGPASRAVLSLWGRGWAPPDAPPHPPPRGRAGGHERETMNSFLPSRASRLIRPSASDSYKPPEAPLICTPFSALHPGRRKGRGLNGGRWEPGQRAQSPKEQIGGSFVPPSGLSGPHRLSPSFVPRARAGHPPGPFR